MRTHTAMGSPAEVITLRILCTFTAGTATVSLPAPLPPGRLFLTGYLLDGVDVLAGVPTLQYIRLAFDLESSQSKMLGNVRPGAILMLAAGSTRTVQQGIYEFVGAVHQSTSTLTITARDPSEAVPTLASALLSCRLEPFTQALPGVRRAGF